MCVLQGLVRCVLSTTVHDSTRVYTNMYKSVHGCTSIYRSVQICTGMHKYAQVCMYNSNDISLLYVNHA